MASIEFDASELRTLSADLSRASTKIAGEARGLVNTGALKIKRQLVAEMGASAHFKGAARDISYDIVADRDGVEAQVGPRSGRGNPGALGLIAYFGTSKGGGTVPDPKGALEAEIPHFEKALGDVLGGLL